MKMKTLIGLVLLLVITHSVRAKEVSQWEAPEESCDFVKQKQPLEPEAFMNEFLKRDSEGEFISSSPWLDKSALCPGHLGGPDSHHVISGFKIEKSRILPESAAFTVSYDVLGVMSSGGSEGELESFKAEKKNLTTEFKMVKTPFGWRFNRLDRGMVLGAAALKHATRPWVEGEEQKFREATGIQK